MRSLTPRLGLAFALTLFTLAVSQACDDPPLPIVAPGSTGGTAGAAGAMATGGTLGTGGAEDRPCILCPPP